MTKNKMDPCKPCVDKYGINDLNSVNNCCFQNCARESGAINVWDIVPTECGQKCMACLDKAKLARGRSLCYQRRIAPPPIFVERYKGSDKDVSDNIDYSKYRKDQPYAFYISLVISSLVLGLVLFIVVSAIFGRK